MAKAVTDIAQRARDKKLLPDEVQGGTFTITNPGGYGTFHGTPVISQPQAGILGTYAVVKRPWVVQDDMSWVLGTVSSPFHAGCGTGVPVNSPLHG